MREIIINEDFTVIELFRNNEYEYYLSKKDYGHLLFSFGTYERFSDEDIINLFENNYFDYEIEFFDSMEW